MIYLLPEDLDGAPHVADNFSILTTGLMMAPNSTKTSSGKSSNRIRRLSGRPIPIFMRRGRSAWFYEGTYISKPLFRLSEALWSSPELMLVRLGVPIMLRGPV